MENYGPLEARDSGLWALGPSLKPMNKRNPTYKRADLPSFVQTFNQETHTQADAKHPIRSFSLSLVNPAPAGFPVLR
ncbi:hypothetical protein Hanom_Chr05g00434101 [Helianthus anomalus]